MVLVLFYNAVLSVPSSFAIINRGRKMVACVNCVLAEIRMQAFCISSERYSEVCDLPFPVNVSHRYLTLKSLYASA